MKRKIVRRTYTLQHGEPCHKVVYAIAPRDAYGSEGFSNDFDDAYFFKDNDWLNASFWDCEINGNDRYGNFSYKQEVLDVEIILPK